MLLNSSAVMTFLLDTPDRTIFVLDLLSSSLATETGLTPHHPPEPEGVPEHCRKIAFGEPDGLLKLLMQDTCFDGIWCWLWHDRRT